MKYHYNRNQMAETFKQVGLKSGDVVFSHSNIGYFGLPEEGRTRDAIFKTILGAFFDVVGDEGTLVVPTFTYSFCKGEPFDPENTPSICGIFTEMLRLHPDSKRSCDPIFSVVALGRQAKNLVENISKECFGKDSFWDKFYKSDGVLCNLNFDAGSTFIHYAERCLNVPYRYDKLFTGKIIQNGIEKKSAVIYFCRDLNNPDTVAAFEPFDKLARKKELAKSVFVGRGAILSIRATDVFTLIKKELKSNPQLLIAASSKRFSKISHKSRISKRTFNVSLPKKATMDQMINEIWQLPRDIISDGFDTALNALAQQIPMKIHSYPTGTRCWTWIIPEKWTCHEAYLETMDGNKIFSYSDNPLHVISYSLSFEGVVTREELFNHLYIHPKISEAIPFIFKYYEQDWGLCCSQNMKAALTDDRYRVVIKTSFSYGALKVGEVVVPGENEECIMLCAHLCHPAMVNDDLTGVIAGIDIMRKLLKQQHLKYTYRLIIVPETIGSIAYLSHNETLIPKIKGGLFLEMLGLEHPHALQTSFYENTELDECFKLALKDYDANNSWIGAFRKVIGNDERQFNSPGVRIPMLSLSRVLKSTNKDYPYKEYHSSYDNIDLMSFGNLYKSRDLVLKMISVIENNFVPINKFKGEVFCSRFGLHFDWYTSREENENLFSVLYLIDGNYSLAQIAKKCNTSFDVVKNITDKLMELGLIKYSNHLNMF